MFPDPVTELTSITTLKEGHVSHSWRPSLCSFCFFLSFFQVSCFLFMVTYGKCADGDEKWPQKVPQITFQKSTPFFIRSAHKNSHLISSKTATRAHVGLLFLDASLRTKTTCAQDCFCCWLSCCLCFLITATVIQTFINTRTSSQIT